MQAKPTLSFFVTILLISCIAMLAADIYLPALPEMAQYFHATQEEVQASLSIFMLGLAYCQLGYGMLSDWLGRKNVLLVGLSIFILASLGCTQVTTLAQLNIWRFIQALGAGITVIGRVLVSERYDREQSVQILTTIFPIAGLTPALAPCLGGYISQHFGWRANFYVISLYGLIALMNIVLFLPKDRVIKKTFVLSKETVNKLLFNYQFVGFTIVIATGYCVFRTYMVESPFIFAKQGFVAAQIGNFYLVAGIAYLIGNLIAKFLAKKISLNRVLSYGFICFICGNIALLLAGKYAGHLALAAILPMAIITIGNGLIFPIATASALATVSPNLAGTAAGVVGTVQYVMAAFCVFIVGSLAKANIYQLAVFLSMVTFTGLVSFWVFILRPKYKARF